MGVQGFRGLVVSLPWWWELYHDVNLYCGEMNAAAGREQSLVKQALSALHQNGIALEILQRPPNGLHIAASIIHFKGSQVFVGQVWADLHHKSPWIAKRRLWICVPSVSHQIAALFLHRQKKENKNKNNSQPFGGSCACCGRHCPLFHIPLLNTPLAWPTLLA